jgi:hypothetical protein
MEAIREELDMEFEGRVKPAVKPSNPSCSSTKSGLDPRRFLADNF